MLALLLGFVLAHAAPSLSHAIVIDAGSKGTRILIFDCNSSSVPSVLGIKSLHPGLSFFALEPEKLRPILTELVEYAHETLEAMKDEWYKFPIYLKGTAGLRDLLPYRRDAVMDEVQTVLAQSRFYFTKRQATVISGEEEAAFAWLTLNTIRNSLESHGDRSFGVLDLGGASLQVAFVPAEGHYVLEHFFPMQLNTNNAISLYAKSYLHYGSVEIQRRLDALIISNSLLQVESLSEIDNPCFTKNLNYTPDFSSDLFKIPINVRMRGSGDYENCKQLLEQLMNKRASCWVKDCTFDGTYQPRVQQRRFVATSGFAKIAKYLDLKSKSSMEDIKSAAVTVCQLTLSELDKRFPHLKFTEKVELCFTATYIHTLLTHGLGFDDSEPGQIEFLKDEGKGVVDWALGALIWELDRTPPRVGKDREAAELRQSII